MKTLLTPALQAGFLAALILTVVQMFTAIPLILEAETYEQAAEPASVVESAPAAPAAHSHTADAVPDHHSAEAAQEEWEPENGWQRTLATASANTVMGVGFALVLVGLFRFRAPKNALTGLAWGAAGYLSVFAAPSLGLHPELPGTAAAELVGRQEWWIGTVLATAIGLSLCVLTRSWSLRVIGFVLIALPYLIGAPLPAVKEALAPEALQHQFILTSALLNALFWAVLGVASAWFYVRANRGAENPSASAAS